LPVRRQPYIKFEAIASLRQREFKRLQRILGNCLLSARTAVAEKQRTDGFCWTLTTGH
jgi:hypothetical protein